MANALYIHVQIRKDDTTPSHRLELRRIYRRGPLEFVRWENQWYETHADPSLDVYYLLLGSGQKNLLDKESA